jgi:hypothetical protein
MGGFVHIKVNDNAVSLFIISRFGRFEVKSTARRMGLMVRVRTTLEEL